MVTLMTWDWLHPEPPDDRDQMDIWPPQSRDHRGIVQLEGRAHPGHDT